MTSQALDPNSCNLPQQYFSCDSSNGGFKGCCTVNACFYGGCPDNELCNRQMDTPCGNVCCNGKTKCIAIGVCQGGQANSPGNDEPVTNAPSVIQTAPATTRMTTSAQIATTARSLTTAGPPASIGSSSSKSFSQRSLAIRCLHHLYCPSTRLLQLSR